MASDLRKVLLNPREFADIVTHTARDTTSFDVVAIWTPSIQGVLADTGEGRAVPMSGVLIVSDRTCTGQETVIDDQGNFTIDSHVWQVENVIPVNGGYSVTVKRASQKQIRTIRPHR